MRNKPGAGGATGVEKSLEEMRRNGGVSSICCSSTGPVLIVLVGRKISIVADHAVNRQSVELKTVLALNIA